MAVPQDEASQLVVQALAPQNGERIADLCSGVGIKTSQILSLAPEAELLAVDIDKQKLDKAIELSKTAGLGGFDTLAMDATRLPEHLDGSFDAVLLDALVLGLERLGVVQKCAICVGTGCQTGCQAASEAVTKGFASFKTWWPIDLCSLFVCP